jgi:phospholipid-binding lipoprotein MlaA
MRLSSLSKGLTLFTLFLVGFHSPLCMGDDNPDPWEHFNRDGFVVNQKVDKYIYKPVAEYYHNHVPQLVRGGVSNFYNNFYQSVTIANDLLQWDLYFVLQDTWRFAINSTLGIGGLYDMAAKMGLPAYSTDFGITLRKWGWKTNFLVVPCWGPTTLGDYIGSWVNYYAFSFYPLINPWQILYPMLALNYLNKRSELLDVQSLMDQLSFDEYVFQRDAYLQYRDGMLEKSKANTGIRPPADYQPIITKDLVPVYRFRYGR